MSEWKTEPLDQCLESLIDYRGKSPTKSRTGIPVLSAKVVKTTGLLRPIEQTIAPDYYPQWMTRGLPRVGDVVMTTEAPMGEVIQLDEETSKFALGQRIVCMRGKAGKLDNTFLRYLLTSPGQQEILASYSTGTTVLGISQKALRSVPISYPDFDEQVIIGELLSALDDKIELNRRMNETLEASARALFRDWFVDFGPTRAKVEGRPAYLAPDLWSLFPATLDAEGKPEGWEWSTIGKEVRSVFLWRLNEPSTKDIPCGMETSPGLRRKTISGFEVVHVLDATGRTMAPRLDYRPIVRSPAGNRTHVVACTSLGDLAITQIPLSDQSGGVHRDALQWLRIQLACLFWAKENITRHCPECQRLHAGNQQGKFPTVPFIDAGRQRSA
jgi:hypothetical protein